MFLLPAKRERVSPLQPLMTRPSSAHTLAHVTSQSWPVRMARGVVNSPERQGFFKKTKQKQRHTSWPLEGATHMTWSAE